MSPLVGPMTGTPLITPAVTSPSAWAIAHLADLGGSLPI
jgi:hypothetical protein